VAECSWWVGWLQKRWAADRPGGEIGDGQWRLMAKATAADRSRALLTRLLDSARTRRAQVQWMSVRRSERLRLIAGQRDGQRLGWLICDRRLDSHSLLCTRTPRHSHHQAQATVSTDASQWE
jgi:hypothetical protein